MVQTSSQVLSIWTCPQVNRIVYSLFRMTQGHHFPNKKQQTEGCNKAKQSYQLHLMVSIYRVAAEYVHVVHALLVYKCLHGLAPEYLTRVCVLLSTLSGRPHLRSSEDNKLFVPRSFTASMGPRAFCSSGPTSWNTLPARLRHSSLTLEQFKCLLKASLFAWLSPQVAH